MTTSEAMVLCAGLAAAGCASHEVTSVEYDEIAQIAAASIATPDGGGDAGAFADAAMLARGDMPEGFAIDARTGMATGYHDGLGYVYMVFCKDAAGAPLDRCGPAAATATVIGAWHGTLAMGELGGTVQRDGTWTMTGLAHRPAKISGGSHLVFDVDLTTGVHYHAELAESLAALLDMDAASPMGGTVTTQIVADRSPVRAVMQNSSFTVDAEATFLSGRQAFLVLDQVHGYRIDLVTGAVTPAPLLRL